MTMEQKRAAIMQQAETLFSAAKSFGHEWAVLGTLKIEITRIMKWYNTPELTLKTVENMAAKGIIEISKTGKGFKLLSK